MKRAGLRCPALAASTPCSSVWGRFWGSLLEGVFWRRGFVGLSWSLFRRLRQRRRRRGPRIELGRNREVMTGRHEDVVPDPLAHGVLGKPLSPVGLAVAPHDLEGI